jgi:uncharacterized membrane protein
MTRTVKWLVTGLCFSVALNLLVVGFTAARFMGGPGFAGAHMRLSMEHMMGKLSEDSQQILRDTIEAQRGPIGDKMLAMHEGNRAIVALLAAEELDQTALDQAFADQRQRNIELQEALQAAIIQVAQQLEPAERIKLAQGGDRLMRRMVEHRQPHHGSDEPLIESEKMR